MSGSRELENRAWDSAVDEIERLKAENAELRLLNEAYGKHGQQLLEAHDFIAQRGRELVESRAAVALLREALEPFAGSIYDLTAAHWDKAIKIYESTGATE